MVLPQGRAALVRLFLQASRRYRSVAELFGPFATNPLGIPSSVLLSFCGGAFTSTCNDTNTNTTYTTTGHPEGCARSMARKSTGSSRSISCPILSTVSGSWATLPSSRRSQTYILMPATATTSAITTRPICQGLSRTTYNATLYYDDSVFEARISAAFRSKFLVTAGPTSGLSPTTPSIRPRRSIWTPRPATRSTTISPLTCRPST